MIRFPLQLAPGTGSLTKEERDRMSPAQVIEELKKGNERFRTRKMAPRDYIAEKRSSAAGQYPAAMILGCVDSRVPAEIIFDVGIGDTFNGRLAGNVVNDDLLGSMEFACALSGAKLVLVLGHSACGAIKGAIDDAVLGNLTGLLARIKPAIPETKFEGEKSSKNPAYVDAVARTNVTLALENIRRRSPGVGGSGKERVDPDYGRNVQPCKRYGGLRELVKKTLAIAEQVWLLTLVR